MKVSMQDGNGLSLEQIRAWLAVNETVGFDGIDRAETYEWMTETLRRHRYREQKRSVKGLLRRYLAKRTGRSIPQVTRLVRQFVREGAVQEASYRRHKFPSRYTGGDIELLAGVDEAHDTLSGPATRRILEREFQEYGHKAYERLSGISVGHLYNLRKHRRYRERRLDFTKTRPVQISIGERRKPQPDGKPGYLRVDTVHQGDQDGEKGIYHLNSVDEVTQWEVAGATEHISEAWLKPVLEGMLEQFPFVILGFHSDNGSEFINHVIAGLLNKLLIEQTKSRPRHSNDNGLVEAKNGAVIRKHMGYLYIAAPHAEKVQEFYREHLNPYLNFHRPCGQPEIRVDAKGKERRVYPRYATPWEAFQALPKAEQYLKPGLTMEQLRRNAGAESDTENARRMQQAKRKLFTKFHQERRHASA